MTDRCATCAHFKANDDVDDDLPRRIGVPWWYPGDDEVDPAVIEKARSERWGWCRLIGLPEHRVAVTVPAYVTDGSDYIATLNVRSDFGCTLHAPCVVIDEETQ